MSDGKFTENAVTQGSTEGSTEDELVKPKEVDVSAGKKSDESTTDEDAVAEATSGGFVEYNVMEINGERYVKASGDTASGWVTTVNGIAYVPESAAQKYKTARSVLQQYT